MAATTPEDELSLWRPGTTRDALVGFLGASVDLPVAARVAMFDNDGTLWCERPTYNQFQFIVWAARRRMANDPDFVVTDDMRRLGDGAAQLPSDMTLDQIAAALNHTFEGLTPAEFRRLGQQFAAEWRHPRFGLLHDLRYAPMLQLLVALERREFTTFIVTGGGIEFVRSVAPELYGVPPERIVGSFVNYHYDAKKRELRRGHDIVGHPNEGEEKVIRTQQMLGRQPILTAGNSAGDGPLLDYTIGTGDHGVRMALLIDHDDADREYAYESVAASFSNGRNIVDVGRESGWQIVSMRDDWATVFASTDTAPK